LCTGRWVEDYKEPASTLCGLLLATCYMRLLVTTDGWMDDGGFSVAFLAAHAAYRQCSTAWWIHRVHIEHVGSPRPVHNPCVPFRFVSRFHFAVYDVLTQVRWPLAWQPLAGGALHVQSTRLQSLRGEKYYTHPVGAAQRSAGTAAVDSGVPCCGLSVCSSARQAATDSTRRTYKMNEVRGLITLYSPGEVHQ
jgi:hypothetical protein